MVLGAMFEVYDMEIFVLVPRVSRFWTHFVRGPSMSLAEFFTGIIVGQS
jgi:hypothetical protein